MALMPRQASGNLQVQCSLMLVLEISKVSGSTRRTSAKERLPEGHCIPFQSQPGKDAAVKQHLIMQPSERESETESGHCSSLKAQQEEFGAMVPN